MMGQFTLQSHHAPSPPLSPYRQLWSQTFSPQPWDHRKEDSEKPEVDVTVSTFQKCINFFGCIVAAAVYFYLLLYSNHLWTIDTSLSIFLAEYCGWSNEKLRRKTTGEEEPKSEKSDDLSIVEKGDYFTLLNNLPNSKPECIAAVVGYREDPVIFTKALESYLRADSCRFVLVSIDGNGLQDQDMVDVFQKVCYSGFSNHVNWNHNH
jgi:hyaluronan synthase